jgi:hypothetical protein
MSFTWVSCCGCCCQISEHDGPWQFGKGRQGFDQRARGLLRTSECSVSRHPLGISIEHLQRYLSDTWVASAIDHSEDVGMDVFARIVELSVIEGVKKFGPELDADALRDPRVFQQRHIKVVDAGTVEETPSGQTKVSKPRFQKRFSSKHCPASRTNQSCAFDTWLSVQHSDMNFLPGNGSEQVRHILNGAPCFARSGDKADPARAWKKKEHFQRKSESRAGLGAAFERKGCCGYVGELGAI